MLRKADFDLLQNVLSHSFLPPCLALFFFFFSKRDSRFQKWVLRRKNQQRRPASKTQEKKKNKQNKTWNNNNNKYKLKITISSLNQSFSIASVRFQILKTKQQQQQEPKAWEISRVGKKLLKEERGVVVRTNFNTKKRIKSELTWFIGKKSLYFKGKRKG